MKKICIRLASYAETLKKSTLKSIQKALQKANAAATKRLEEEARKASMKQIVGNLKDQLKDILQFLPPDINLSRYQRASLANLEKMEAALRNLYNKKNVRGPNSGAEISSEKRTRTSR